MDLRLDHDGRRADAGRGLLSTSSGVKATKPLPASTPYFASKVLSLMLVDIHVLPDPVEGQQKLAPCCGCGDREENQPKRTNARNPRATR